jgi:hypothetical protein
MVYQVMEQLVPEHIPNRESAAIKECHGLIKLIVLKCAESCHRLLMDATKSGSKEWDLAWAFKVWGFVLETEAPFGYSKCQACIDLAEMPCELAYRTALRVGPEIVLVNGERLEQADGVLGFSIPGLEKSVEFHAVSHILPPDGSS